MWSNFTDKGGIVWHGAVRHDTLLPGEVTKHKYKQLMCGPDRNTIHSITSQCIIKMTLNLKYQDICRVWWYRLKILLYYFKAVSLSAHTHGCILFLSLALSVLTPPMMFWDPAALKHCFLCENSWLQSHLDTCSHTPAHVGKRRADTHILFHAGQSWNSLYCQPIVEFISCREREEGVYSVPAIRVSWSAAETL